MLSSREVRYDLNEVPFVDQAVQNPASVKQLMHLGQIIKAKSFNKFDYDPWFPKLNEELYNGRSEPPEIPIQNI
jgi:hypothetical protein